MALLAGLGSFGLLAGGLGGCRGGYETAPYRVLRADDNFELRDYAALSVAETSMERGNDGSKGSFNRLFRFITGANELKQKIPMTTPVLMSGSGAEAKMAFVMPANMKASLIPKPSEPGVTVRVLPAGRFAVLRYHGERSAKNEAESLERLRAWAKAEGFETDLPAIHGYFDPPWTLPALRRNEVMLRVQPASRD